MAQEIWWASPSFWRKSAIWVTGLSFVVLIFLTFDTVKQITAGSPRVPAYSVINKRIDYVFLVPNESASILSSGLAFDRPVRLEVSLFDSQLLAAIDGRLLGAACWGWSRAACRILSGVRSSIRTAPKRLLPVKVPLLRFGTCR